MDNSGKVLLVDDEQTIVTVGKRMLQVLGFDVDTALTGVEALEIFSRCPRQWLAVILDMSMPEMDGPKLARGMREIRDDVPILISSGYGPQEVKQRFGDQAVSGLIQKPFRVEDLSRAIQRATARNANI
jgi:CheY-like chemotaxis protein